MAVPFVDRFSLRAQSPLPRPSPLPFRDSRLDPEPAAADAKLDGMCEGIIVNELQEVSMANSGPTLNDSRWTDRTRNVEMFFSSKKFEKVGGQAGVTIGSEMTRTGVL